ncbi:MAG: alpha-glucosidase [Coriobacteriia bacterium]|nr:alpha-glucosidase [Coriobacteriia bacterium]
MNKNLTRRKFCAIGGTALLSSLVIPSCTFKGNSNANLESMKWWQKTIVYELYPKSFKDTADQGTGTLKGITEKLPYLAELRIGAIWITPIYKSPMKDNGYDIADYYDIDPRFGSMADMEELIAQAEKHNIKIVMDLVMNHTSDENKWFVESCLSKDNKYADWYIWRDPKSDGTPPNNWRGIFGGSAWKYSKARNQYYLHTFGDYQPDLNWANPEVRQEMANMANFWLNKGVGGFRIDAVSYIKKPDDFSDGKPDAADGMSRIHDLTAITDGILDYVNEFADRVSKGKDIFMVAEANGVAASDLNKWVGEKAPFDMLFEFSHVLVPLGGKEVWYKPANWKLTELKSALTQSQENTATNGWYPIFFENHDQPRSVNHFFSKESNKQDAARAMLTVLMTLRGTPFLYQAEELGYENVAWPSISDYNDVSSKNQYKMALEDGYSEEAAIEAVHDFSRDNARTPVQWDNTQNAGFSTSNPWLPVHDDYKTCNVETQKTNPNSILNWYKKLLKLRQENDVFIAGDYAEHMKDNEQVYAYTRKYGNTEATVFVNFSNKAASYDISLIEKAKIILNSHDKHNTGELKPLEAVVYIKEV